MTSRTKLLKIAKTMANASLTANMLDPKKVKKVTEAAIALKPANLTKILKIYKNLIENKIRSEEVTIEISQKNAISKQFEQDIKKTTGAKRVSYVINPKLIAGAKITHGDWVYDATLEAKLEQLTINN
mgnify:CR=1 FL=1